MVKSWLWTSRDLHACVGIVSDDVDLDWLALARALSTQAGMLFEDASATVILVGNLKTDDLRETLTQALDINMRAGNFLEAASALIDYRAND